MDQSAKFTVSTALALLVIPKGLHQGELCIRKPTDLQYSLSRRRGVVAGIDLRRSHVELAEPNGWVVGINRHGAMITQKAGKAYPEAKA